LKVLSVANALAAPISSGKFTRRVTGKPETIDPCGLVPDKRACIDLSGQLPGGRLDGSNRKHMTVELACRPCSESDQFQPKRQRNTIWMVAGPCFYDPCSGPAASAPLANYRACGFGTTSGHSKWSDPFPLPGPARVSQTKMVSAAPRRIVTITASLGLRRNQPLGTRAKLHLRGR
jgi:hypothetical protein